MKEIARILQDEKGNLYLEYRNRTCLHRFNKKVVAKLKRGLIYKKEVKQ